MNTFVNDKGFTECKHCGKGKKSHFDWDDPQCGGECKNAIHYGGCVGEWSCLYDHTETRTPLFNNDGIEKGTLITKGETDKTILININQKLTLTEKQCDDLALILDRVVKRFF